MYMYHISTDIPGLRTYAILMLFASDVARKYFMTTVHVRHVGALNNTA